MSFQPENWVLVCDTKIDPHSQKQIDNLQSQNYANKLKGAIDCGLDKNKDVEACKQVPAFPSFCNTETNVCISGYRSTTEQY
jgi:hypothetical protein